MTYAVLSLTAVSITRSSSARMLRMCGDAQPSPRFLLMSRIKSKDTKPELAVRSFLHRRGFRYSLHRRDLPGTPDIVLLRYRFVVFVNGCLWHRHIPCSKYLPLKIRKEYWLPKIRANRRRDARLRRELRSLGWKVITVWECQIDHGIMHEARLEPLLANRRASPPRYGKALRFLSAFSIARFEAAALSKRLGRIIRRVRRELPIPIGRRSDFV